MTPSFNSIVIALALLAPISAVAAPARARTTSKTSSSRGKTATTPLTILHHAGSSHGYLALDVPSRRALIIDAPTGAADRFLPEIERRGLTVGAIVLTHTHADHTADVEALWRGTGAGIALHGGDPIPAQQPNGPRLHLLREGDLLALGPHRLEIMHVPGHSFDSIALWESKQKILFSGDTVQAGGYGGNLRDPDFLSSMARIAALPGDARLLAGHGRATTVGDEAGWMNSMVEEQSAFLLAHPSAIVTPTCNCRLHSTRSLYNRPGPLF